MSKTARWILIIIIALLIAILLAILACETVIAPHTTLLPEQWVGI